jgi:hypothetical protein
MIKTPSDVFVRSKNTHLKLSDFHKPNGFFNLNGPHGGLGKETGERERERLLKLTLLTMRCDEPEYSFHLLYTH